MRPSLVLLIASLSLLAPNVGRAQSPADTATIVRGAVVSREAGAALSHAVIAIPALGVERFTDDRGIFTLTGVAAGRQRLVVRHLGYASADTTITVIAGQPVQVRVALTRLAVRLAAVRVTPDKPCLTPGAPTRARDPVSWAVFEQLRENANRMRLLRDSYPYQMLMERTLGSGSSGSRKVEGVDSVIFRSTADWHYRPGHVVANEMRQGLHAEWVLHVPALTDFADSSFEALHCFEYAGVETVGDQRLVRIDFKTYAKHMAPDVDGSVYLDTASFQLRRAQLRLTKPPAAMRGLRGVTVTSVYREIGSDIVVLDHVWGVNYTKVGLFGRGTGEATEDQRLLSVTFLGDAPPGVLLPDRQSKVPSSIHNPREIHR
ncbi:MAG: hypothetical protein JWO05_2596 [Gemmatimonadetes bacterium]|nr:hypothetical protein [Gemmatimonadota bacterium]